MKTSLKTILLGTIVFLICGAPTITFDAIFPAEINVPGNIKSLAIINRSQIDKKGLSIIEGGLTGEGINQDKAASQICLDGLFTRLNNSRRYTAVRTQKNYTNSGMGVEFPDPLNWTEIESLCNEFKSDAIISLDIFDSDFLGNYAQVKVGFRLYDLSTRTIIDQINYSQKMAWSQPATSVQSVISRVLDKNDAIRDAAHQAGVRYGERISPTWYRVHRIYYNHGKGSNDLKVGARMMDVNDWDAAIEALNNAMNDRHRKVKGRSAHNLAVIYEILGEYDLAREWAQAAWGKYRNKDSKNYSYALGQRMAEIERVKSQTADDEVIGDQ